jgi:putative hydrolase of the HAD superfamily
MIKAITFDLWMTLYRNPTGGLGRRKHARRRLFEKFLADHGSSASLKRQLQAWKRANRIFEHQWRHDHRSLSTRERIQRVLDELQVKYSQRELPSLAKAYEDFTLLAPPRLIHGVAETIPLLARGFRLAIICDTGITSGRVLRRVLKNDGLLRYFRYCVFSDEVGRTKPHTDNFHLALRKLRVRPHEAVHIGDLIRTDIRGAQHAGMHAVLFTAFQRYSDRKIRAEARGVPVVKTFCKIPKAVALLS